MKIAKKSQQTSNRGNSTSKRKPSAKELGILHGYRSGLEETIAEQLDKAGVSYEYEQEVIRYVKPEKTAKYTPDFLLENGIIVETKGRFLTADRQKHLLVKHQHPDKDIRFVFSNSKTKISKTSKTTYADWCIKNGFQFADKRIPEDWLIEEKPKHV
jgi:hypothetical protein